MRIIGLIWLEKLYELGITSYICLLISNDKMFSNKTNEILRGNFISTT